MRWRFFPSPRCLISYVELWIFFLALSRNGTFRCAYDPFHYRYGWHQNCVDFLDIPTAQKFVHLVYFLSGLLVHYHCAAGGLLCICETDGAWTAEGYRESGVMERKKRKKKKRFWIKGV